MIEKLIENYNQCSGLKIAAGKEKSPKSLETLRILDLVPVTGLDYSIVAHQLLSW